MCFPITNEAQITSYPGWQATQQSCTNWKETFWFPSLVGSQDVTDRMLPQIFFFLSFSVPGIYLSLYSSPPSLPVHLSNLRLKKRPCTPASDSQDRCWPVPFHPRSQLASSDWEKGKARILSNENYKNFFFLSVNDNRKMRLKKLLWHGKGGEGRMILDDNVIWPFQLPRSMTLILYGRTWPHGGPWRETDSPHASCMQ